MSAYQVGPDTVDLIVSAALDYEWSGERHRGGFAVYFPSYATIYTDAARALVREVGARPDGTTLLAFELPPTLVTDDGATAGDILGRELIAANVASVAARYPSDTRADTVGGMVSYLPESYEFRRVARDRFADYGHVLGALACFEYQSCETMRATLAESVCDAVRRSVAMRIADATAEETGLSAWGWDRDAARGAREALRASIRKAVTA